MCEGVTGGAEGNIRGSEKGAWGSKTAAGSRCVVAEHGCERAVARVPFALRAAAVTTSDEVPEMGLLRGALNDWHGVLHRAEDEVGPCGAGCGGMAEGHTAPSYRHLAPFSPLFVLSAWPLAVVVMRTVAPPEAADPAALVRP